MRRLARILSLACPLAVVLGLSKVHAAWVADIPYDFTGSFRLPWAFAYAALLAVAAYGVGLPDVARSRREALAASTAGSVVAGLGVSILQLFVGDALLPRFVVFGAAVFLLPVQVAIWTVARRGRARDEDRDRVVLVASAADFERLQADLHLMPERPAGLVGHLTPERASKEGGDGEAPLIELARRDRVSVVVLDRSALASPSVVSQAAVLHEDGLRVRTLVQFYEEWLGKLPVSELERSSLFFDISEVHRVRYARIKRLSDVVLALVGLVPFVVSVPLVALANVVANRGPLFFRQERVGRAGAPFQILKYRTMRDPSHGSSAGPSGAWTAIDDERVTPFGRFLRASHLDELPQVLNIVRGELSVVGPRPEQPRYVEELSGSLPFYGMRHLVRPGLTGWAQVKYGYARDATGSLEKLQYEFFYLRHQSLRFDLRVIGRTVRSMVGSEGSGR